MSNIEEFFKDPKKGLIGIDALHRKMKEEGINVTKKEIKKVLEGNESYSLNKSVKRKGKTRKTITKYPNQQWQADLVEMDVPQGAPASQNDGIKYLITIIDVFSRYAWVRTLKSKKGEEIIKAFTDVFKEGKKPKYLQTDKGSEFYNKKVEDFLKRNNIGLFSTHGDGKATVVERFNRTLKMRMGKLFDVNQNFRYVDNLKDLVENYNNTYHSTIKMTPLEAQDDSNIIEVYENTLGEEEEKEEPNFKKGDLVRIPMHKNKFSKEIIGNWTIEIFKVKEILNTNPITYKIEDLKGEEIKGSFYEYEFNKVSKDVLNKSFRIEKVIERKGKKALVKWLGWPEKFNEWIKI